MTGMAPEKKTVDPAEAQMHQSGAANRTGRYGSKSPVSRARARLLEDGAGRAAGGDQGLDAHEVTPWGSVKLAFYPYDARTRAETDQRVADHRVGCNARVETETKHPRRATTGARCLEGTQFASPPRAEPEIGHEARKERAAERQIECATRGLGSVVST